MKLVHVLLFDNNRLFLVKPRGREVYVFPKTEVLGHEMDGDAAMRVIEDVGFDAEFVKSVKYSEVVRLVVLDRIGGRIRNKEKYKDVRWVSKSSLDGKLSSNLLDFVKMV